METTFRIICKTTLGIDASTVVEEYHRHLIQVIRLSSLRDFDPVMMSSDLIYNMSSNGRLSSKCIKKLLAITDLIIVNRLKELLDTLNDLNFDEDSNSGTVIDLLLRQHFQDPKSMTLEDILNWIF